MAIIVKGHYFPGFTEPERNAKLEAYLVSRKYDQSQGGAEIAWVFHQNMHHDGVTLDLGAQGFNRLDQTTDVRNRFMASCMRVNCMAEIWWMVEFQEGKAEDWWCLYAGTWNQRLAFMCLDAPHYHENPVVWVAQDPERVKPLLDLASA